MHLLKYKFQPRARSRAWRATIAEQRQRIAAVIEDSPSLQDFPETILARCYADAVPGAALETGLPHSAFPQDCPFALDQILDPGWLPSGQRGGA